VYLAALHCFEPGSECEGSAAMGVMKGAL